MERNVLTPLTCFILITGYLVCAWNLPHLNNLEWPDLIFWFYLTFSITPIALLFLIPWKTLPKAFSLAFLSLLGGFITTGIIINVWMFNYLRLYPYLDLLVLICPITFVLFSRHFTPSSTRTTSLKEKLLITTGLAMAMSSCLLIYNRLDFYPVRFPPLDTSSEVVVSLTTVLFGPLALTYLIPWKKLPYSLYIGTGIILIPLLCVGATTIYSLYSAYQELLYGLFYSKHTLLPLTLSMLSGSTLLFTIHRKEINYLTQVSALVFTLSTAIFITNFNQKPFEINSWVLFQPEDNKTQIQALDNNNAAVYFSFSSAQDPVSDYIITTIKEKGSMRLRAKELNHHTDFTLLPSKEKNAFYTVCKSQQEAEALVKQVKSCSVYE